MLAEDDRVVVRCLFEGTHDGTFLGMPPTGRRVSIEHIDIYRIQDDMVAEHWACRDDISGFRQLGTQPARPDAPDTATTWVAAPAPRPLAQQPPCNRRCICKDQAGIGALRR
jgi:hypothetical protein